MFKLLCTVLLSFFCLFVHATDEAFKNEIIGVWSLGEKDEFHNKEFFLLEYKEDGTTHYQAFKDGNCSELEFEIFGSWAIKNSKLFNTALKGTGQLKVPLGLTFVDQIVSLENGEMVLETDRNRMAYRSKKLPCNPINESTQ